MLLIINKINLRKVQISIEVEFLTCILTFYKNTYTYFSEIIVITVY